MMLLHASRAQHASTKPRLHGYYKPREKQNIKNEGQNAAKTFLGAPLAIALIALALSWRTPPPAKVAPLNRGRNNTILFLTGELNGVSNVHVASSFALLENYPGFEVHYASFPALEKIITRVSAAARAKTPSAQPLVWHTLPGPSMETTMLRVVGQGYGDLIQQPGAAGLDKKLRDVSSVYVGWTAEEHWALYEAMRELVEEVDPAVVVFDHVVKPAVDLAANLDRRVMTISPNVLTDLVIDVQPWAVTMPVLKAHRAFLTAKGVKDALPLRVWPKGTPLLTMTIPEANLPMGKVPAELTFCGPIVLDTAPAAEQDAELAAWLKRGRGRTVLVNLGTLFRYDEARAGALVGALAKVLETVQDVQVLWKFRKLGDYGDDVLEPLQRFVRDGRLKVESWLKTDPPSLLGTGDVSLFVHHGGANGYHEAVLAGVPQVFLPLWFDLFNIASMAEYLGIGVWPSRDTAPEWEAEALADGIRRALVGAESEALRDKAKALGDVARRYRGRDAAADEIAKLAALGE
ncbi:Glycosyltransferase sdnJ [Paramyrothecium foliicola]|nr:Glycosyltransferase sdnJ [Paramyrothecium foliicola]